MHVCVHIQGLTRKSPSEMGERPPGSVVAEVTQGAGALSLQVSFVHSAT